MNYKILYGIILIFFVGGLFSAAYAGPTLDFGDAPDGGPTGYAGLFEQIGSFPTLLASDGARVLDTTKVTLGAAVTNEVDANVMDGADDGVDGLMIVLVSIPPPAMLSLTATSNLVSSDNYFLNVLIDQNLSGEWGDNAGGNGEWVVANMAVTLLPGVNQIAPPAFAFGFGNRLPDGAWMRVALTKEAVTPDPVKGWLGDGSFSSGEIEDYKLVLGTSDGKKNSQPVINCGPTVKDFAGANVLNFNCVITNMGGDGNVQWKFQRINGKVDLTATAGAGVLPGDIKTPGPGAKVNGVTPILGPWGPVGVAPGTATLNMKADKAQPLPSLWKVTVKDPNGYCNEDSCTWSSQGVNWYQFVDSLNPPAGAIPYSGNVFDNIPGSTFHGSCLVTITDDNTGFGGVNLGPTCLAVPDSVTGNWQSNCPVPPATLYSSICVTEYDRTWGTTDSYPTMDPPMGGVPNQDFGLNWNHPSELTKTVYIDLDEDGFFDDLIDLEIITDIPEAIRAVLPVGDVDVEDIPDKVGMFSITQNLRDDFGTNIYQGTLPGVPTQPVPGTFDFIGGSGPYPYSSSSSFEESNRTPDSWKNIEELKSPASNGQGQESVSVASCPGNDPSSDTFVPQPGFATHDVCDVKAEYDAASGKLIFEITTVSLFDNPIDDPNDGLVGFFDIDADQNPATGNFGFGGNPGIEFTILFFHPFFGSGPGLAQVFENISFGFASMNSQLEYGPNTVSFEMDPCALGGLNFDYFGVVGTLNGGPTDAFPNIATPLTNTGTPSCGNPVYIVPHFTGNPPLQLFFGYEAGPDTDLDTVLDLIDNCPNDANTNQNDIDNDFTGDACDPDTKITTNTVATDTTFGGDLTVDGASFTIPNGITVDFDFANFKITVKSPNGKILIELGGKIT